MPDVLRHVPAAASVPSITVASTTLPAQLTLAPISNLQTAATIVVTGGEGTLTYSWSSASGGTFGDATALNSSYTPTGGGAHTLVLVVTDANGATAIITLSLTVGADGLVTTYAPDLAAVAAADWRSGGPAFAIEGVDWTARNVSTFATTGVLGPDGSTGIRQKPSGNGDWLGATVSAGGVDFNLADAIPGLDRDTIFDVIFGVTVAADAASDYDIYGAYVGDNPHTSAPRALLQTRVYNSGKKRKAVRQEPTSTDTHVEVSQADPILGFAFRVRGQTITYYQTTSAVSTMPDKDFTGWTELGQVASDDRAPTVVTAWTIANLTAGLLAYRVGGTGVDITLTRLWVRARI